MSTFAVPREHQQRVLVFGIIAALGLCVALVQRRAAMAPRSATALAAGFPVGIAQRSRSC